MKRLRQLELQHSARLAFTCGIWLCDCGSLACRTYGKGLIQSVYQLEDGSALVVTIGKYLTPARTDIDREGLRPDFGSIPDPGSAQATLAACKVPASA